MKSGIFQSTVKKNSGFVTNRVVFHRAIIACCGNIHVGEIMTKKPVCYLRRRIYRAVPREFAKELFKVEISINIPLAGLEN